MFRNLGPFCDQSMKLEVTKGFLCFYIRTIIVGIDITVGTLSSELQLFRFIVRPNGVELYIYRGTLQELLS